MSSNTIDGAAGARQVGHSLGRTLGAWSSATLASMMLAACGGGGGGGDSGSANTPPPPANNPPPAATNVAPTPNSGGDTTVTLPTDNASFTGSATDDGLPSGSSIAYTWEFVSGPSGPGNTPGATLSSTNTADTRVRFAGGPGEYVFNLKASDGALTGTATKRVTVAANPNTYPVTPTTGVSGWVEAAPADVGMSAAKLDEAKTVSESAGGGSDFEAGYIIRNGKLVYQWGDSTRRFEMKSTTKSMGGLALLLALDEGKVTMADKVSDKLPGVFGVDPQVTINTGVTGALSDITVGQLATHTSGLSKSDSPPLVLEHTPGTYWSYSDQGLNWLADVLTQSYAQDLNALLFSRIFTTLGIRTSDLVWRTNDFRSETLNVNGSGVLRRELGSGINADVNAMARVGLLMLRKGVWNNTSLLSNSVVATATTPPAAVAPLTIADPANYPGATTNYGMLWWTNATGQMPSVPKDAFWAWGLHETFIIVIPSLDLVVARAGTEAWTGEGNPEAWNANYSVLEPFLKPIVESVTPTP